MDMAKLRQEGEPFDVVMNRFLAWCGEEEYCFCTWGSIGFDGASEEYGLS